MTDRKPQILLFDFGGVLVDLDKQRCIEAFYRLGFDIRPYLGTYRQGGMFSLLERGAISVPEFCDEIRRMAGNSALTDASIAAAWEQYLVGVPAERLEKLLALRRTYRVCLLSNTNIIHWKQSLRDFFNYKGLGINDFFEEVFLSYELGVEKPAPEIFHIVTQRLGARPEDILFLDDSDVNCQAARDCGLQAQLAPAAGGWMQEIF